MPIIIKDYEWKESENTLTINVPLKNVIQSKANIFNSTRYIKISYNQFFFEAILLHPTDIEQNKCTVTDSLVIFELVKLEKELWGQLEPNISRSEKQRLKQELIEEEHKRFQKELEEKSSKRHELKREAVRLQVALDTKQRNAIEAVRKEEKSKALGDVDEWSKSVSKSIKAINRNAKKLKARNKFKEMPTEKGEDIADEKSQHNVPIPLPRKFQALEIDFTPREFPTPSRESRLEEENEWLRMQAAARRSAGFISEDIRPEERNPQFLLTKGDEFMRNNNYLGAVSAYSFGIKLSDKYVDLYLGRSAAHLALGNFHKVAQDCSTALDLLKPAVEANKAQRATCIGRRGIALCKLGLLTKGIAEIEASLDLIPDEKLKAEHQKYELEWMNKDDSD